MKRRDSNDSFEKEEEEWCRLALGVKKLGFSLAVFLKNFER